ncbi:MAG: hypothetical protein O2807_04955 [bacterium]|nr:hypothetical protein [bacterium]
MRRGAPGQEIRGTRGRLPAHPGRVLPFEAIAGAHRCMEENRACSKMAVRVTDEPINANPAAAVTARTATMMMVRPRPDFIAPSLMDCGDEVKSPATLPGISARSPAERIREKRHPLFWGKREKPSFEKDGIVQY